MWLLNTTTYAVEFVLNPRSYAILSHTWEEDEVTFNDMKDLAVARAKAGWSKIENTCRLAREQWNLDHAWVDTCCIDKSSSAELSEAINSMFEWYKRATVCIAYLSDLEGTEHDPTSDEAWRQLKENLPLCRWFTRGWTLQELIAPGHLDLYDISWSRRGSKSSLKIRTLLTQITKIDENILSNTDNLLAIPVARRMSWASKRKTTRTGDIAYCLLGIFDVNLPMIYGEGEKAFFRLQEAIALATGDLSLFAWEEAEPTTSPFRGIFARNPSEFRDCYSLENINDLNLPEMATPT
ncbi:heterokaryon incompatibility protein-domain-containing protein [Cercophora newfieldiana]|uniref:Heterokaryon incompatibility protein-domain-containing protein n=1 Tax=Cercophora newfieldiana TaxID=92897 RepID=A0AA39XXA1_9PEZI|nr:heterokaryon incompatibility protein-domain-containing protein [Cercophora newfieldiana]